MKMYLKLKIPVDVFNQYMNSDKMTCIICTDIEPLIKKIDVCANNQ